MVVGPPPTLFREPTKGLKKVCIMGKTIGPSRGRFHLRISSASDDEIPIDTTWLQITQLTRASVYAEVLDGALQNIDGIDLKNVDLL